MITPISVDAPQESARLTDRWFRPDYFLGLGELAEPLLLRHATKPWNTADTDIPVLKQAEGGVRGGEVMCVKGFR